MPNYCDYEARLKGKKKDVLKFADWMGAYCVHSDETPKCYTSDPKMGGVPTEHHIGWRIFEGYHDPDALKDYKDDDIVLYTVSGYCAWSVRSCMFEGPLTYCTEHKENPDEVNLSLTLPEACKELNVEAELFSCECGNAFAENYHIGSDGTIIKQDCVDYSETCIADYETYDEMEKEYDENGWTCNVTKELFEDAKKDGYDYIHHCEFFKNNVAFDYEWPFALAM